MESSVSSANPTYTGSVPKMQGAGNRGREVAPVNRRGCTEVRPEQRPVGRASGPERQGQDSWGSGGRGWDYKPSE